MIDEDGIFGIPEGQGWLEDDFTDADSTLLSAHNPANNSTVKWNAAPSTWTISSNAAINTPTLGDEEIADGGFDVDGSWIKEDGTVTVAGSKGNFTASGNVISLYQADTITSPVSKFFKATFTIDSIASGGLKTLLCNSSSGGSKTDAGVYVSNHLILSALIRHANIVTTAANTTAVVDNFSVKAYTTAELFALSNTGFSQGYVKLTDTTIEANSILGAAMCVDSPTNPQNGFIAVLDRTAGTGKVWALNSGTWTSLINTAVTYAAGAEMHLLFDGTYLYFFYNNTLVGTRQDVSAYSTIIHNTRHGMFSTSSGNSIEGIDINPIQLGSELVTNNDFSGTWTGNLPQSWTQVGTVDAGSYLTADDANDRLTIVSDGDSMGIQQNGLFTVGNIYKIEADITSAALGNLKFSDGSGNFGVNEFSTDQDFYGVAKGTLLQVIRSAACNVTIKSVSFKQVQ